MNRQTLHRVLLGTVSMAVALGAFGTTEAWSQSSESHHYSENSEHYVSPTDQEKATESSAMSSNRISGRYIVRTVGARAVTLSSAGGAPETTRLRANGDGEIRGLSGGDGGDWTTGKLAIWSAATGDLFYDEKPAIDLSGLQYAATLGADYRFFDAFLAGVAVGYERLDVTFHGNGDFQRDADYFVTTLYGAYQFTDNWSVNILGSYGLGLNDIIPAGANSGQGNGHHSHRFITSGNVAYSNVYDRITAYGSGGISYAHEGFDAYYDSVGAKVSPDAVELGQLYTEGDVGYIFQMSDENNDIIEPYVSARLEYDFISNGMNDRFGAVLGGGLRAFVNDNLSLEMFGNTEVARSDEATTSFGMNARLQF
ncbi:autotransporter outer membrane beta-barrel domain-containing protein [Rhodospira trueperi]|uniref:Autotransporter domain-containing protein n=1 Tax=Rhodospira trueperi TaxID=69960 RepID=A0A1G7CQG9_9PROT|nr:autotransporter outer membrane beta-barrel domain-containing protein [Rhodospira trueperi]SDE41471.1 hypothetical protein SAMN05421720_106174 [Rhodospira trueperi]